jgi:hypothetical protein
MTVVHEAERAGLSTRDDLNPKIRRMYDSYQKSPEREEARRLQEERLVGAAELMYQVVGHEVK